MSDARSDDTRTRSERRTHHEATRRMQSARDPQQGHPGVTQAVDQGFPDACFGWDADFDPQAHVDEAYACDEDDKTDAPSSSVRPSRLDARASRVPRDGLSQALAVVPAARTSDRHADGAKAASERSKGRSRGRRRARAARLAPAQRGRRRRHVRVVRAHPHPRRRHGRAARARLADATSTRSRGEGSGQRRRLGRAARRARELARALAGRRVGSSRGTRGRSDDDARGARRVPGAPPRDRSSSQSESDTSSGCTTSTA